MIDERYIELINKEIDGVITKTEQDRLHSHLSVNPAALNFYHELRRTSDLLSDIPKLDPSPNIKRHVMNSIDLNRYSVSQKPDTFRSLLLTWFTWPSPKLAYAFALGILIGILVHSVILENSPSKDGGNVTDMYGTIGMNEKAAFEIIKDMPITHPEINGTIVIKKHGNIVMIETVLRTRQSMEMFIEYDESYLQFSHFSTGDRSKTTFESGGNYLRASCLGDSQYDLFFTELKADRKDIILKLFASGKVLYVQSISLTTDIGN